MPLRCHVLLLTKISYYMPLMAKNAGVVSTKQQLLMNALQSPIMTIGTILGVRFIDKAGKLTLKDCTMQLTKGHRTKSYVNGLKHNLLILCSHGSDLQRTPKHPP